MSPLAQFARAIAKPVLPALAALMSVHAPLAAGNADADIVPLPPISAGFDTSSSDHAMVGPSPPPVAEAPVAKLAAEPAEALEGPPVPLRPLDRLSTTDNEGKCRAQATDASKPITLDLKDADLRAALHTFAQFTGLNIVASEKVRGQVSMNLVAVPWRRAFDTLLEVNGLAMEQHGNVI